MSRLTLAVAIAFLSGCASTGNWRTLNIDGSSESAFGASLSRLNDELPYARNQMFALALVDIANTRAQTAGEAEDGAPAYSEEVFRTELDGLTYEGVVALADQSGPSIRTLYSYRHWGEALSGVNRGPTAGQQQSSFAPTTPQYQDTHSGYVWPTAWPASQ